jgi:hypothetical protein
LEPRSEVSGEARASRNLIVDDVQIFYEAIFSEDSMSRAVGKIVMATRWLLLLFVIFLAACHKSENTSSRTFLSPNDAGNQLLKAAKSGDQNAVLAIFGAGSKDVIFSGDTVQDKSAVEAFVAAYSQMHRWREMPDMSQILLIGADNFAFPIPLKKNDDGRWFFDTAAGKDEILRRRIGRNELAVIEICDALADAQAQYFSQYHDGGSTKQYALKFISDVGKQNGLYWESSAGQPQSPLGPLVAFATTEGYRAKPDSHVPFHGYYFHMLSGQGSHASDGAKDYVVDGKMVGGFGFIAYPAEYGNSGVMTFSINQDGVLFQKDLGKTTAETASTMSQFDPDAGWVPVEQ